MRQATFKTTLNQASDSLVTVNYATQDGSAVAPDNYTAKSGTVTFAVGETSKDIIVLVNDDAPAETETNFYVVLSSPVNGVLGTSSGTATIPGSDTPVAINYLERFKTIYDKVHNVDNKYFGPQTGANARTLPRHIPGVDSIIINEAPDHGGETVSETASFWVGLEAWNGYVTGQLGTADWTGYNNAWNRIDQFYVPSPTNQPIAVYTPSSPADYTPEGDTPSVYPTLGDPTAAKGADPLADELESTYGNKRMYLMHWILDVEGLYNFRNGDGTKQNVFINTYERGMQESSFETVTHPAWNDFANGGSIYGYDPLFTQGTQWYPAAANDWGKKWSYTNAPDAEGRAIQWSFWAQKFATEQGASTTISASTTKAKKMGDYMRYNLFDKYFRKIGDNQVGGKGYESCHYLVNWYAAWGGEIPASGATGSWSYRIGSSECHQGYQAIDSAYFMATGGGGFTSLSPSASDIWLGSVYRQMEMLRWLQSPEGPLAGGVTNSWNARYETPTDGRQNAKFYGMVYTYAPVWHDPPSNDWVGFQTWGQGRTADLFLEVSDKTTPLAVTLKANLEIILDPLVVWFLNNSTLTSDGSFQLPGTLSWVSPTQVVGQTATTPNHEGVYEYLPSLNWDGTGNQASFWNASTVPNPNLHCSIVEYATDLGVASSLAYLLITYAKAKKNLGKYTSKIKSTNHTAETAMLFAKELLDRMWNLYVDDVGLAIDSPQPGYKRLFDEVYVPEIFTGTMPNGEQIKSGVKFHELRTFLHNDPKWAEVAAYATGASTTPPVFRYHRFWAQSEFAISLAALHRYFNDEL
ncbi:hypothetical protein pEaSNUABM56_00101 [Erwinia phage pEa_SNUABM_56]|uniref:Putative glycoside hydrolase n=1 Tax=Erwinia phage pEp_SNUABM_01 TaxID=2601643 RepID=A0A5J6DAM2_9CAUD|nr:putative glycoside hydrolase [Erwinia phage pEp_SNUABM_01]QEQ94900.1 putative glycoside hydrolase [Erwinia phage pEp_SNUABM_01]UYL84830.1 hypothetical protein pEaSNUABM55_00032 [Erwinia phage pEa_SNUABM_55]UYL85146.1 hypothetical protein pEaSNUABM56_00101 [Erwinia phage pEa_SNUABM_56]